MKRRAVFSWLDAHFEEALLAVLLAVICAVSILQVIVRNLPFVPALRWAEEFCRFAWVWCVFLSLPYTIRHGTMLKADMLLRLLPYRAGQILSVAADVLTALTMGLLCVGSVPVVRGIRQSAELSPAMAIPMWTVYSVVFLGTLLASFRSVQRCVRHIRFLHEKNGEGESTWRP